MQLDPVDYFLLSLIALCAAGIAFAEIHRRRQTKRRPFYRVTGP
jgi:hypothetical protein